MRKISLFAFFISVSAVLNAQIVKSSEQPLEKNTPVALVEQQLAAYNARNIDAFLVPYADSIEFYTFPNQLTLAGKERLRRGYSDFFQKVPDLHCEIRGRIVQGNIVIDKERLTGLSGKMEVEATAIYEIEAEKIKKVYFIQ